MAKGSANTGLLVAIGAALLGGLALASGSSVSPAQLNDYVTGRIFYTIGVFESAYRGGIDFGAWALRRNSRLFGGWEASYGVLQSRINIGLYDIVSRYAELLGGTTTPNSSIILPYLQNGTLQSIKTDSGAFQRFITALGQAHTASTGQRKTLKQAFVDAGRSEKAMRQAQVEYFMKEYLNKAFSFADSKGLRYPVSRLIVAGATIINGYGGMKSKIKRFLQGGNELSEMMAFARYLEGYLPGATGMQGTSIRGRTYITLIQSDPNLQRPYSVKGIPVPVNVTLESLIAQVQATTPQSFDELGSNILDPAFAGDASQNSVFFGEDSPFEGGGYQDPGGGYGPSIEPAAWGGDSFGSDSFSDAGWDDMGMGDMGGDFFPQMPQTAPYLPSWYRGSGYYRDVHNNVFWVR